LPQGSADSFYGIHPNFIFTWEPCAVKPGFDPVVAQFAVAALILDSADYCGYLYRMANTSTIVLNVEGMTCANCAHIVERALAAVPGVAKASVNALSKTAHVTLASPDTSADDLIVAVQRAGYGARISPARAADRETAERHSAWFRLLRTAVVGVLLFGSWLLGNMDLIPWDLARMLILVATVLTAAPIAWRAAKTLAHRRLGADVLVTIAVIAAVSVGEFFAAGEVAFILLLGSQLEDYTARRARRSIGSLLSLVPATARVRRPSMSLEGAAPRERGATCRVPQRGHAIAPNGGSRPAAPLQSPTEVELEIPADDVQVGDLVVVRAGERTPVDGVVRSGDASLNQAAVTGESMPVDKAAGDEVFVGSLAETGALVIEATRVGADTTLARIARVVEQAQQERAPIQRTLDRFAGWLVPVMLTLAALVFIVTHDVARAITVLIVACPCALILATPVAVMAAIARAARAGVLIKGGQHLEAAARLNTIVFDKTGTLTYGQPEVAHVHRFDEHTESELVGMAAVAEKMSAHPVARAILRKADTLGMPPPRDPTTFAAHLGRGVTAEHEGQKLVVGQKSLLAEHEVELSDKLQSHVDEHHDEGHTIVVVAHDGKVCGTICVADTVRVRADDAIKELRSLGIENIVMLTGDNHRVAMRIGNALGVDEVKAEVLPEQKAEYIESLKKRSGRNNGVAMVGDGVNDAPALAVADVGIAMGVTGTDIAHEAADIALMADDLSKIAYAVGLSRQALRVIKQGLWFALVYNVIMVTTAATGHLHMIGGAIAHQASSIVVILNAMRLLRHR
jgi:Cd2+/Zn2+-exporting ATPase